MRQPFRLLVTGRRMTAAFERFSSCQEGNREMQ